jgi:N-acetylmuramoyl-L-alanine amidase
VSRRKDKLVVKSLPAHYSCGQVFSILVLCQIAFWWQLPGVEAAEPSTEPPLPSKQVVVIDPGHGDKDKGIVLSEYMAEKDYVLAVARALKEALQNQSRISIFLTRKRDIPLSILERTTLANRKEADVFISLHISSVVRNRHRDFCLYVNQEVNPATLSGLYSADILSTNQAVPWDLAQNGQRQQSLRLGRTLLECGPGSGAGKKAELLQAPLAILAGVRAPAVLIELPVSITAGKNQKETEAKILVLAQNLARGIVGFLANR